MREKSIYAMLRGIKGISRVFYRFDINWVHPPSSDPWRQLRLVVFLNHTSLYEPLFVGGFPPDTMVIIMPEGRMMRANGLDKNGRAMTVRGGVADIVRSIPQGLLLLRPGAGISAALCGLSRINLPAATLVAHFIPFAFRK